MLSCLRMSADAHLLIQVKCRIEYSQDWDTVILVNNNIRHSNHHHTLPVPPGHNISPVHTADMNFSTPGLCYDCMFPKRGKNNAEKKISKRYPAKSNKLFSITLDQQSFGRNEKILRSHNFFYDRTAAHLYYI